MVAPTTETKAYVARRTAEGKTRREIRRCLMRNLARRLYPLLIADLHDAKTIPLLTSETRRTSHGAATA